MDGCALRNAAAGVARGGDYVNGAAQLVTAFRYSQEWVVRNEAFGFRCARTVP